MFKNLWKHKIVLFLTIALFLLFIVLTALLKFVDVAAIGESATNVGLSKINSGIFNKIGTSDMFDSITDLILIFSLLIVVFMFGFGCYKLFGEKKLDLTIVILGGFYVLLLILYVAFDHIHINYAPLLDEGSPKESYPSSHVLATLFVSLSAIMIVGNNIKNVKVKYALTIILVLIALLMTIFRLLSGWHWFTDILGAEVLSMFLVSLYVLIFLSLEKKEIDLSKKDEKELH